jgi:hypothetical protein
LCELLREADYDKFVDGVILFAAPLMGDVVSISEELGCYRIHGRNDSGLGRMPDGGSLERDINRFLARMEHLRAIIRRLNRSFPSNAERGIDHGHQSSVDHQARQTVSRKGAGIDLDPVWSQFYLARGRMAVNDNLAKIVFRRQEFLPYPKQIPFLLL